VPLKQTTELEWAEEDIPDTLVDLLETDGREGSIRDARDLNWSPRFTLIMLR
jgi:hypothetical protein